MIKLRFIQRKASLVKTWTFLLFMLFTSVLSVHAQSIVTGIVTDDTGEGIPGVSVILKGTTQGTITDIEGKYSTDANAKDILIFSYIGMRSQEIRVNGKDVVNVTLLEDVEALEEVVVVGYGTTRKSSLTGAVSAVKGDDLLKAPATNLSSLLGGRLPGISSVQESGEPGVDQASLRIRGSMYDVTYIVDGMPRSINDIDPNDIESVSVLKDGASAAVYGLKGAGGVIIVTTKKGAQGKSKISYNGSVGVSMNANFPKFMDGPQFAHYYNMASMMDQLGNGTINDRSDFVPVFTKSQVDMMLNNDPTDGWDNVNYVDRVFGKGLNQKHSISATGGNENITYFTSIGYLGVDGNIDNFSYKRYNLRSNIEAKMAKNLTLNVNLVGNVGNRHTPGYASGGTDSDSNLGEQGWLSIAHQTISMHPYLPEKYNGLYTAAPAKNTGLAQSPLAAIYESGYKKTKTVDIQSLISLQYDLPWVKGLSLKATGSYDYSTSHNKNLDTPYEVNAIKLPDSTQDLTYTVTADPRGNAYIKLGEGYTGSQQIVGQASISYNNKFDLHNVDVMGIAEIRDYTTRNFSAYAKELDFSELPELNLGKPAESPIAGMSDGIRNIGYVFRVKYDYDARYLAELTGRYDGSYKFAGNVSGKRWGFFPSASLAWRMSGESFMEELTFIDDLKVRASVGLLGNDGVPAYSFLSRYVFGNKYPVAGILQNTLYTSGIANPNLTWEKTLSYNAGFDITMWGGLLGMEVDAFYTYTYDILTQMGGNYPPSMGGYYPLYENYNKVDVRGIDILVSHRNSRFTLGSKPFTYGVTASVTYAKNRYLRFPDSPNIPEWQKVTGKSVFASYGWVADGLYRSEEEIDNSAWYGSRPNLGDIKYKDLNGDGKIDSQDRARIGRNNRPELTFGLNLSAEWRGFDLSAQFVGGALFDISLTGTYYNGYDDNTIWTQTFKEGANSPLYLVENAYSIDNPNGTFPRITTGTLSHGGDNGLASTFWFRDGKYLRLKSTQLGYSFPRQWIRKAGMENLRIFAEGSNLFTISGLPDGIDPESPGVNNGYYPQQRTFMGGVTVTF